jgi:transcriptional regulator with XRE-family HTH domain
MNIEILTKLPQVSLNLRYQLYKEKLAPARWEDVAAKKLKIGLYRMRSIMNGDESLSPEEQEAVAEWCGRSVDDLGSAPIYPADTEGMTKENLRFLIGSLKGQGGQKKLAQALGVLPSQVSRWKKGGVIPHGSNLRDLLKFFSLDADLDLGKTPLFLANFPIHGVAQKEWIIQRLQEMPHEQLAPHFPSISKLISPE